MTPTELASAASRLLALAGDRAFLAIGLGTGLAGISDALGLRPVASFEELGLPSPTIHGHPGRVATGLVSGCPVVAFQGRVHLYEGFSLEATTRWARMALAAGIGRFAITNAAGGLATNFAAGDIMVLRDHISFPGLCGYPRVEPPSEYPWPRFTSLDGLYDARMAELALLAANGQGLRAHGGVYAMVAGPTYETPAERLLLRRLGADAVGMSTVPEAIAAFSAGARVLGLSIITNVVHDPTPPTHEEVARVSQAGCSAIAGVLAEVITELAKEEKR